MSGFAVLIEGDARIVVVGEVDMATAPQVTSAIESLDRAGSPRVVVDLAGVSFMDSTGLSALVHGRAKLESRGAALVLGALSTQVQTLLQVAGLESTFVRQSPIT
jgi:anti-sigma B factor antagonist